jgi:acylphosphatase
MPEARRARRARLLMVVSGRVQGVFFRSAAEQARALGIVGYVRNRDDGSVEIVAEGDRNALEIFAAWARRGPTSARVEDLRIEWSDAGDEFERFKIR